MVRRAQRQPGLNRRTALFGGLLPAAVLGLLVLSGCGGDPPTAQPRGDRVKHPELDLSIVLPEGWQLRSSRDGFALLRQTPYGGGYPSFNVRVVGAEDLPSLRFDGKRFASPAGVVEYRYERWSNARGRGYRLEGLVDADGSWLFVDASVWDPARSRDERFFDEVFWPLLNSVRTK